MKRRQRWSVLDAEHGAAAFRSSVQCPSSHLDGNRPDLDSGWSSVRQGEKGCEMEREDGDGRGEGVRRKLMTLYELHHRR